MYSKPRQFAPPFHQLLSILNSRGKKLIVLSIINNLLRWTQPNLSSLLLRTNSQEKIHSRSHSRSTIDLSKLISITSPYSIDLLQYSLKISIFIKFKKRRKLIIDTRKQFTSPLLLEKYKKIPPPQIKSTLFLRQPDSTIHLQVA